MAMASLTALLSTVSLLLLFVASLATAINHGGLDTEFANTLVLSETNGLVFYWSYAPENEQVSMALRCLSSACEGYFAIGFNDVATSSPYMSGSHAIIGDCVAPSGASIHEFFLGGITDNQVVQEPTSTLISKSCEIDESTTTLRFSRPQQSATYSLDVFGNQSQTIIYAIGYAGSTATSPTYHKSKGVTSWPSTLTNQPTPRPTLVETLTPADCTVIGAGPGGILAADVLSGNSQCATLRLLERGGAPIIGTYTTLPFSDTYTKQPEYTAANHNGGPLSFASVFGGQQTTNGGVFSPGSPEDLSTALGVTLTDAAAAQECAAVSIERTTLHFDGPIVPSVPNIEFQEQVARNGLMAVCDNADQESCSWGDMILAPTDIRRRTVAHRVHGEGVPSYASLNTEVDRIVFTQGSDALVAKSVIFADGTISPVAPGGKVFLAANALGSARILARSDHARWSSFAFHNHFHTYSYVPQHAVGAGASHKDTWQYEFTTPEVSVNNLFGEEITCSGQRFELDFRGNFPVADGMVQVVLMQMEPELRVSGSYDTLTDELSLNDEDASVCDIAARKKAVLVYTASWGTAEHSPNFAGFATSPSELAWGQSWHFAGGIPLASSGSRIEGTANVFSADTGAIRSPFSCHTSMVSAAAGVVASMQAIGQPITNCLEHISSSSDNPVVTLPLSAPTILPSPRQIQVAASWTNELIMVTRTEISSGVEVLAARSYNGFEWESAPPVLLPIVCGNSIDSSLPVYKSKGANMSVVCNTTIPENEFELYVYKIRVAHHEPLSDTYAASRFLTQTTFGATRASIEDFKSQYSNDIPSFLSAQMNEPATLHREYFRERANPAQLATPSSGYARGACAPGSRWSKFAFHNQYLNNQTVIVMDQLQSSPGHVSLSVEGHIRTIVPTSHMAGTTLLDDTYPITLSVCKVSPRVGGKVTLCNKKSFLNPQVQFTLGDPVESDRIVLRHPLVALEDVPGKKGDTVILSPNVDASTLVSSCDAAPVAGPLFAFDEDSGDLFIENKRIEFIGNTLDAPAMSANQPLCTSAAKTFLNEDSCVPNLDACVTQSYSSADVTLDTESVRKLYTLSQQYVYIINGLQLIEDNLNPMDPCNGKRSRWIQSTEATETGCDAWDTKSTEYKTMLLDVIGANIQAADNDNESIRDLQLSPQVCTSDVLPFIPETETFLNVHVLVDSVCWKQSHPEEMNVYDFSGWATSHPGNSDASDNGSPNPITNPAVLGSAILNFPYWHAQERWDQREGSSQIKFIGRFNDTINFVSLPLSLQLPATASHFGAEGEISFGGSESCGSPGEIANNASKGHQFQAAYGGTSRHKYQSTDRPGSEDLDIRNTQVQSAVWTSVAVRAKDQLRQRVAWVLSQIFVINEDSIGSKDLSEIYVNYYDIFVRNAFGNYRDIMREVALSPMMAKMLSSLDSKSLKYSGYYPDENFAREIMQLFSFGLYRLNENGTRITNDDGIELQTYSTKDIENFAKAWTGLRRRSERSNIELQSTMINGIDPLKINRNFRDHTPKTNLSGGYLGDAVQVCSDMAEQSFLRIGAKYQFMGRDHRTRAATVNRDEPVSKKPLVANPTGSLYAALCNPDGDGSCAFASVVALSKNLDCDGKECDIDTVRMVAMADTAGGDDKFVYYEYVRPACVEMEFFENAKTIANTRYGQQANNGKTNHPMCANPKSFAAAPICCVKGDQGDLNRKGSSVCQYESERVSFATAEARCELKGKELCEYGRSSPNKCEYFKLQYHSYGWFPTPCVLSAQVHSDGSINVLHKTSINLNSNIHNLNSVELYDVLWDQGAYPTVTDNCSSACAVRGDTCVCQTSVETASVFTDITQLPTKAEIQSRLFIGASNPASFDSDVYVKCVSAVCIGDPDVSVYSRGGSTSNPLLNAETIFEVRGEYVASKIFYSNVKSVVSIAGKFAFRNPPKYTVQTEITERDAEHETEAVFDVYMNHPSTPAFVAKSFIQHLVTSNPTPRYIHSVATAFKRGIFNQFGLGKRGDMAATIAAVLMDKEAQSPILDHDLSHGRMREPLIKLIHSLRALELESKPGFEDIKLGDRISQHPYRAPSVFNYFQYDHRPSGPLAQTGLVAPEAQLMAGPEVLGFMNYLNTIVRYQASADSNTYSLTLVADEADSAADVVEDLNMLLLAGRLNSHSRSVIEEAYSTELNKNSVLAASKVAQSLVMATSEFATTTANALTQIARQSMEVDDQVYSQGGRVYTSSYKQKSCDATAYTKAEANYKCNRDSNCQFLIDHKCRGTTYRLCTDVNKIPGWYNKIPSKQSCTLLKPQPEESEEPKETTRSKAIVYIMFSGGADSWSMLAPYDTCEGGKDLYQEYADLRTNIALLKADMLPINAEQLSLHSSQTCERFGLHPNLPNVQAMYNEGDALLIANMGTLVEPLTKEEFYLNSKAAPFNLFAHNVQQDITQRVDAQTERVDGVIGRLFHSLHKTKALKTSMYAIANDPSVLQPGIGGGKAVQYVSSDGPGSLDGLWSGHLAKVANLSSRVSESGFANTWSEKLESAVAKTIFYSSVMSNIKLETNFGSNILGKQLEVVSILIKANTETFKDDATAYFVTLGGFDTHGDNIKFAANMLVFDDALQKFKDEMVAQGMWDDVTVIQASDFGRSLTSNGAGTDHGWGGNYMMAGGSIRGGQILGEYPREMTKNGKDMISRGRVLPTTSWEAVWNAVGQFMGVDDSEMDTVLPLRKNFDNLFGLEDVFDTPPIAPPSSSPSETPTSLPSIHASAKPSPSPTISPIISPTSQLSDSPTFQPSSSTRPSSFPTMSPIISPTVQPSDLPTSQPSLSPSLSRKPSLKPSMPPSSSAAPSSKPFIGHWKAQMAAHVIFFVLVNRCSQ